MPASSFLRLVQLDQLVNAEDGDGGLGRELHTLHLRDQRLEHAGFFVVAHDAGFEVETRPGMKANTPV